MDRPNTAAQAYKVSGDMAAESFLYEQRERLTKAEALLRHACEHAPQNPSEQETMKRDFAILYATNEISNALSAIDSALGFSN